MRPKWTYLLYNKPTKAMCNHNQWPRYGLFTRQNLELLRYIVLTSDWLRNPRK